MAKSGFDRTFAALRGVLEPYATTMRVVVDKPAEYQLCEADRTDRVGRPLFVASVAKRKNYVSFHFMPVYACPDLVKKLSPALKKRMQGKSCFNFTDLDPAHVDELAILTRIGIERFRNVKPPWSG